MEEIGCKCQIFLSLLSGRRKQTSDIFFPSLCKFKSRFLLKYCVAIHLKLTILKPWVNQCIFLMEMFVFSYVNVLHIYPRLCLQVGSAYWLRTYLANQYVILRHCSPNLCKWNYLYGNLPFYKIQVNRFMAWDDLSVPRLSQNTSYGWGAWCHSEF